MVTKALGLLLGVSVCGCASGGFALEVRGFAESIPPVRVWDCRVVYTNESSKAVWVVIPESFDWPLESAMAFNVIHFENVGNGGCVEAFHTKGSHHFFAYPVGAGGKLVASSHRVESTKPNGVLEVWVVEDLLLGGGKPIESLSDTDRWCNPRTEPGKVVQLEGPRFSGCVSRKQLQDKDAFSIFVSARERYKVALTGK